MTGGGLIALVAYGSQNVALSGNPQLTFFYKVFRRYSHFALENVQQLMDGPDQLFYDQPIKVRFKIPRVGDLISDMYFAFQLPDIYSKFVDPTIRSNQYEFKWTNYVGVNIIQSAAFFIGGQKIQEFDGSYLLAKGLLDHTNDKFQKWQTLVGNTPPLTDPANSIYAGGTTLTGYPTVVKDLSRDTQQNRPSIFGQRVYVPIPFWFSDSEGSALPLVALQYHECEVQLTLSPIQNLYTILDASGYRVRPGVQTLCPSMNVLSNIPDYGTVYDASGEIRSFLVDIGYTTPALNTWNLEPTILTTYVYLGEEERNVFASTPLSHLVHQVTGYSFPTIYNRQILSLEVHNPIERLVVVNRRSDSLPFRNAFANFTNWWNYPAAPFIPPPGASFYYRTTNSSGILLPFAQKDILQSLRVLADGNELQEEKDITFFRTIVPYKYPDGNPDQDIPVYNFCLHSLNGQPSGSINASRIRNFQIEVNPYTLAPNTTYVYDLTIYVENINFVEFQGGMGGLKYAL
jgi:hypothetical protein